MSDRLCQHCGKVFTIVPPANNQRFCEPVCRFFHHVHLNEETGCWEWTSTKNTSGYGCFGAGEKYSRHPAHRWIWIYLHGPLTRQFELHHFYCENPSCVNPYHVEALTPVAHCIYRSPSHPASVNSRKTHCKHGHLFDEKNTWLDINDGSRHCRACDRFRHRERAKRKLQRAGLTVAAPQPTQAAEVTSDQ